jgi:hypothetical protein
MRRGWVALLVLGLFMPAVSHAEGLTTTPHLRTTVIYEDDRTGSDDRNAFTLARSEFGASWSDAGWKATAIGEWVRSAEPGSLMGVAGNSYILRPREIALGVTERYADDWQVTATGGLLLRGSTRLHAGDPLAYIEGNPAQRFMGDDVADLGAEVRVGWAGLAEATVAVHNGEGSLDVERNGGKNLTAGLVLTPGGTEGFWGLVPRLEAYREQGSLGAGEQEVTRTEGLVSVAHDVGELRVRYGVGEGSVARADGSSSWLRTTLESAPIFQGFSILALHEQQAPDDDVDGAITRAGGGVRWQGERGLLLPTLTLWFEQLSSDEAAASVPGAGSATEGSRLQLALTLRDRGIVARP